MSLTPQPAPSVPEDPVTLAHQLFDAAWQIEQEGEYEQALTIYRQALPLVPADTDFSRTIALVVSNLAALSSDEALVAPTDPAALAAIFDSAVAARHRGEFETARELVEQVLNQDPGYSRQGTSARGLLHTLDKLVAGTGGGRTGLLARLPMPGLYPFTPRSLLLSGGVFFVAGLMSLALFSAVVVSVGNLSDGAEVHIPPPLASRSGSPLPVMLPEISEVASPGLNDRPAWHSARSAFESRSWTNAIQSLDSLRADGFDVAEVRSLLVAAHVNQGDDLFQGGDRDGGLAEYEAAKSLDPENSAVQERLDQFLVASLATTGTPTPTRTGTPRPTSTPEVGAPDGGPVVIAGDPATSTPTAVRSVPVSPTVPTPATPVPTVPSVRATSTPGPPTPPPPPTATFTATEVPLPTATTAPTIERPPAPTGLAGVAQRCGKILLSWSYPPNVSAGFNVYRNGAFAGGVTNRDFTDTGLQPGTVYSYTVTARSQGGESDHAGPRDVQTQPFNPACDQR